MNREFWSSSDLGWAPLASLYPSTVEIKKLSTTSFHPAILLLSAGVSWVPWKPSQLRQSTLFCTFTIICFRTIKNSFFMAFYHYFYTSILFLYQHTKPKNFRSFLFSIWLWVCLFSEYISPSFQLPNYKEAQRSMPFKNSGNFSANISSNTITVQFPMGSPFGVPICFLSLSLYSPCFLISLS